MPAKLLDGEALALKIKEQLRAEIKSLVAQGVQPHLVAVQVGENPASRIYTKQQKKACEDMGLLYELKELPADTTQDGLIAEIDKLNNDKNVTGIIL